MTDAVKEFRAHLSRMPIVAILRGVRPDEAADIGRALVAAGITIIEVPLNSPSPFDSIAALVQAIPRSDGMIGAGTVLTTQETALVAQAGGQLIVSPNMDARVIRDTKRLGLVSAPGVMTPTEAFAALEAGADLLKLFPGELVPPPAVKAMRAVLPPQTKSLVVGGVHAGNMEAYLQAGAAGFGVGSALYTPGLTPEEVYDRAVKLVRAVRPVV
jgi:2-dehydro-3-deoxyphosphogalactonate aldolase